MTRKTIDKEIFKKEGEKTYISFEMLDQNIYWKILMIFTHN